MLRTTPSLRSGSKMQVRRPTQLVLEVPQFGDEVFLPLDFLGEPLGFLTRIARCGLLAPKTFRDGWFPTESSVRRNSPAP